MVLEKVIRHYTRFVYRQKKEEKEAKRASVVDSEFASRVVGCVTKAGKSN